MNEAQIWAVATVIGTHATCFALAVVLDWRDAVKRRKSSLQNAGVLATPGETSTNK